MKKVEKILRNYKYESSRIIQILQDIQAEYKYLPKNILENVSQKLKMPLSQVYSLSTFYTTFSLKPRGKHLVTVCMGTACHVRGAATILGEFERRLQIEPGENTQDMEYALETVNCLGCCAIGPIVVSDSKYMGEFKIKDISHVLQKQ